MIRRNNLTNFSNIINKNKPKVGQTPKTAIWRKNKATVWFYPAREQKYQTPLFLIYSLVSKSYILDLSPETSMIQAFTTHGYNVYLLDFGVPGYEDKDLTLDDYVTKYIEKGVECSLAHSNTKDLTIIGYCLGGTLATMYAAITSQRIKNLILLVAPIDFSHIPLPVNWKQMLKNERPAIENLIDQYGIIPPNVIDKGIKVITSPISITPYLALSDKRGDSHSVEKWQAFNHWARDHIPFVGGTIKQLIFDIALDNKLAKNRLILNGKRVNLRNIKSNLLVVSANNDDLVPEKSTSPIIRLVSSKDKTYKSINGGHASLAVKGYLPDFLKKWLAEHSHSINTE
ncbi:alpha/beta fold hydrolase [Fredinandcohnia humi]